MPPLERLRAVLSYDPETGHLTWLRRQRSDFKSDRACSTWNARFAGKAAFTARCKNGYTSGAVDGKTYRGHRLAMAMHLGRTLSPDEIVDHLNGDRGDNRAANMRLTTKSGNGRNMLSRTSRTKSTRVGVSWSAAKRKWRAYALGRHIGYFSTEEDAVAARENADRDHGFIMRGET